MTRSKCVKLGLAGFAVFTLTVVSGPTRALAKDDSKVNLVRVPDKGIQPQVAVDGRGAVHLIYFKGDPYKGDLFYVRSTDEGATFSKPLRVNSKPGSAIAVGNIRGAHLALGKKNRVHVAWNGSTPETVRQVNQSPMLYARLNDKGDSFEEQRNLIEEAFGLDGGGSVAADDAGNVYVAWHAPTLGLKGERNRRVWVTSSTDEGKTFAKEKPAFEEVTGACGCCGMRAFADKKGTVYVLYRSASKSVHRDIYLLTSTKKGEPFQGEKIHEWKTDVCPMSSASLVEGPKGVLAAWETEGQVYFSTIDSKTGKRSDPLAAPDKGGDRKHPAMAAGAKGETILVWTEGMGWEKGGTVAWQVYDKAGKPTAGKGRAEGVPMWSLVAVIPQADGGFTIFY